MYLLAFSGMRRNRANKEEGNRARRAKELHVSRKFALLLPDIPHAIVHAVHVVHVGDVGDAGDAGDAWAYDT